MKKKYFKIIVVISALMLSCKKIESFKILEHTSMTTYTYKSIDELKLKLDYYKPQQNTANNYTVIYVHGGGFSSGQRDSRKTIKFAENLGKNGFATISISYRLTRAGLGFGCDLFASEKIKTFNEASKDIEDALKFLKKIKENLI